MEMRATREVLLKRYGLVFFDDLSEGPELPASYVQAIELELAQLAYVPSTRLAARMRRLSVGALAELQAWIRDTLAAAVGGGVVHEPLFRSFPDGIPDDTYELWAQKVGVQFAQAEGQPCLFCRETGTTHVLDPCRHVVCDRCFDGSKYSACPVCEQAVDRKSPFFKPSKLARTATPERVQFKLLDAGDSLDAATRKLVLGFCERTQAMSPDDVAALKAVVGDLRARVLAWLPEVIPVRENIAHLFGTLFRSCEPAIVLPVAARYLKTATDVLRLIAATSGADPSLQGKPAFPVVEVNGDLRRWHGKVIERLDRAKESGRRAVDSRASPPYRQSRQGSPLQGEVLRNEADRREHPASIKTRIQAKRFRVAKLSRPVRRALLQILDGMHPDGLAADMLRHRSMWEWVGKFLHPHEYAELFPNTARAFAIVRGKDPKGVPAPVFKTYYGQLVAAANARDVDTLVELLEQRPGELARRYDHALRIAGDDPVAASKVMAAFATHANKFKTPVLLTLRSVLPTRLAPATMRVYWPKGATTSGVAAPDKRSVLRSDVVASAHRQLDDELLGRFAKHQAFDDCILDDALRDIIVPFNERTASRAMVALPRGSRVPLDASKHVRMFLHWCQPEHGGVTTDIDLSVGFYDAEWANVGTCSWSQLKYPADGSIAKSAGDLRSAKFPNGATEFVDVDREAARAAGIRYCVMVVANYIGMAFGKLERGFAGLMLRDDVRGKHFDPRTVKLRFDLDGENGVYMPLAVDLETNTMHWLDVYGKSMFAMNTVESANDSITTICPNLIGYFASGVRPSMFELAALHAAARSQRVLVRRATGNEQYVRRADEAPAAFLHRLLERREPVERAVLPDPARPVFAALYRGDLEIVDGSTVYALYPERAGATVAASTLIA